MKAMDGDTPFLPEEIITNILKRLPVKSLVRFQCVCKHWKYLIKTPSFIQGHLHHSTHQNPFLLFECFGCLPLHLRLLDHEMQVTELQNAPLIDSMVCVDLIRIVGSSNGLLCIELLGESHSFLLLNPAMREVRSVPQSLDPSEGDNLFVGFGFSSVVNDYKIVRIHVPVISDLVVNKVEVYSLSARSWKEVEVGNLKGVFLRYHYGFTANGAIFWLGLKPGVGENDCHLLVSFDIAMEVFTLIPTPVDINYGTRFTMYEHKLAMVYPTVIGNSESSYIDLWVMEKSTGASEERWTWTKKYTSNPYPCLLSPVTIWRNEIVCVMFGPIRETDGEVENDKIEIVKCNVTTNEFKMFDIRRCGHIHRILHYVESLVPVDSIHIEEP